MRRREKLLIAALAVIVIGYVGRHKVLDWLWSPLQQRQAAVTERREKVAKLERDFARLQADQRRLGVAEGQSLPDDPSVASTLYHRWLLRLAVDAKLQNANVSPSRPVEVGESLYRIPFTISAVSRLAAVRDFLASLDRARLLQKTTYLRLEAEEPGDDPPLQMTLQLESLAIRGAGAGAMAVLQADPPQTKPENEEGRFASITEKNMFRRGYGGPPAPMAVAGDAPPPPPKPDMAQHVYLVGLLTKGDRRELWLYDRMQKRTSVLAEGDKFDVAEVKGQVVAIGATWALVLVDGQTYRLGLGRHLRQFEAVAPAESVTQR